MDNQREHESDPPCDEPRQERHGGWLAAVLRRNRPQGQRGVWTMEPDGRVTRTSRDLRCEPGD